MIDLSERLLSDLDFSQAVQMTTGRVKGVRGGPIKGGGIGYRTTQWGSGGSSAGGHRKTRAMRSLGNHNSPVSKLLGTSKNQKG